MKISTYYIFIVLTLVYLTACRPAVDYFTDHEPEFNLVDYPTFGFVEEDKEVSNNLGVAYSSELEIIRQTIIEQLNERGLEFSESDPALNINIGIVVDERLQTRPTDIVSDPPTYIGQRRYRWEVREVVVGRYNVGTVTLHFIDTKANELVWLGVAEAVISRGRERQERQIREGIEGLIQTIPE